MPFRLAGEPASEKVYEYAHLRRQMPGVRIDRVDGAGVRLVSLQQRGNASAAQMLRRGGVDAARRLPDAVLVEDVAAAREAGASNEVLSMLDGLPEQDYTDIQSVTKLIGSNFGPGLGI